MTVPNNEQSQNIIALGQKLIGLGIQARFNKIEDGPVVTGYYFSLDHSVPVSKVVKKAEDFALAMDTGKVLVQREGGLIAVFVPNKDRAIIDYKDVLHWYLNDPRVNTMELPIPLGMDHKGAKDAFDLCDMPHVLITGSTGSGKSVYEACILTSLAYFKSSDDLHFYLVDTKMVDLPLFGSLPHVQLVADNLQKFHEMMDGIMQEIRRRLKVLQGSGCRKILDYHKMGYHMPYIVVMLDEFGDLMELDSAAKKGGQFEDLPTVKSWIKQAVQIGRAAGVHIIACTQRASVKVVDGDIKANLPCRISLRLPTQVDSRTILGVGGAENLLGKGDMLVQMPERDTVERFHGPFVSVNDIAMLIDDYERIKTQLKRNIS